MSTTLLAPHSSTPPTSQPSTPVMQAPTTTSTQGSQALGPPVPQPNTATPSGPTPSLLTVTPSPGNVSGPPSAGASSTTLRSHATRSGGNPTPQDVVEQHRRAIRDAWIDAEGEIPVLNKDDASSLTPIRYGLLASKDPDGGDSWKEGHGVLLTNYFVVVAKGTTKTTKPSHIIRPIPVECLRLTSFDDEPEVQKQDQSIFRRIGSCTSSPTTKLVYPFTIHHAAAKITRRHTLYAESATERNRWKDALKEAVESRKAKQNNNLLYTLQTVDDKFFRVPPHTPLTRDGHFTGKALCAAEFSYRGIHYLAVGCTNGIYVRERSSDSPFQSVLESDKPTSIAAIPESNAFLVHCESRLFSYRLDHIICVSQSDNGPKNNGDWETRLAEDHGDVLFFKAGRIAGQMLTKSSKQVTSHVLNLTCQNEVPQYQPLGSPMSTPGDPQDATFLTNEVAICTSKAIYILKPTYTPSFRTVLPELPNSERSTNALRRALKGMRSLFREGKKGDPLKVLGLVQCGNKSLIVYDGLGYFMDEDGKPTQPTYHVSWECMATAYARRGSHLLLFSSGFIEVRNVDTGELIQVIERRDVRPLRCGWTEHRMLVAATAGDAANDDGTRKETLVELI